MIGRGGAEEEVPKEAQEDTEITGVDVLLPQGDNLGKTHHKGSSTPLPGDSPVEEPPTRPEGDTYAI